MNAINIIAPRTNSDASSDDFADVAETEDNLFAWART
jgi:hypothetical protein